MCDCIICGKEIIDSETLNGATYTYHCPNCGWYKFTHKFKAFGYFKDITDEELKKYAHYLKETNKNKEYISSSDYILFTAENYKNIIRSKI